MTTDHDLFKFQSDNHTKYKSIISHKYEVYADRMQDEAVSLRRYIFVALAGSAGVILVSSLGISADGQATRSIRNLASISSIWAFLALIFSFATIVMFASHSTAGSSFHNAQLKTVLLAELKSETILLRILPSEFVGDDENIKKFGRYIDEMIDEIDKQFETQRKEIANSETRMQSALKYAVGSICLSGLCTFIAISVPIVSLYFYDYF